ncbi:hypothetical protein [Campylobacter ureolyticus]|uniref:Uncharacterized protein n=2 Tax=Campylobacter ureolyticus TaxID=827 RepID=A0A9Q4PVT2_9BACT|nr:hypothetical protein [Campylobacter ureolyticus]MCZ6162234.1 hypothetical protein [Campylobacter ureolyticus]MCZ6171144.1 hypothetical protein [Campylobacter ureolyticus]MCZ6172261.1 hypothetical protein [Campylobacter ureolyticus]
MEKRKACFYFGSPAESNWKKAEAHNFRKTYVPHLLPVEFREENLYLGNASAKFAQQTFDSSFQKYCADRKGKKPIISNNIREAVVNCCETTTIDDLLRLASVVYNEFGYESLSIAYHCDEGVLRRKSDKKIFTPEIDFVVDKNGITWELEGGGYRDGRMVKGKRTGKKFFDIYNLNEFEPIRNYHCHMTFCCIRDPSKWRRAGYSMSANDLKKLQDMTSKIMKMERGKPRLISQNRRLDWRAYKTKKYIENEVDRYRAELQNTEYSTLTRSREMFKTAVGAIFDGYKQQVRNDEELLKILTNSRKFFESMTDKGDMTTEFYERFQYNFRDFEDKLKERIDKNNLEKRGI